MKLSKNNNPESGGLIAGIILILISITLCTTPFVFSLDMMQWGYGIICINLFIFITGSITFFMYIFRYFRLRSILQGESTIVHWVYSKEKFLEQIKIELEKTKSENKLKLGIVWFFFIVITFVFLVIGFASGEGDSMGWFFGTMLFIVLLITAVAIIMPYISYHNSLKTSTDVIIATNGLYYMGQLHTWNRPLSFLNKLEIDGDKKRIGVHHKIFNENWLV